MNSLDKYNIEKLIKEKNERINKDLKAETNEELLKYYDVILKEAKSDGDNADLIVTYCRNVDGINFAEIQDAIISSKNPHKICYFAKGIPYANVQVGEKHKITEDLTKRGFDLVKLEKALLEIGSAPEIMHFLDSYFHSDLVDVDACLDAILKKDNGTLLGYLVSQHLRICIEHNIFDRILESKTVNVVEFITRCYNYLDGSPYHEKQIQLFKDEMSKAFERMVGKLSDIENGEEDDNEGPQNY